MKKVVIAIVILALIITAGILETVYVDRVFGDLDSRLSALEAQIKEESEEAKESVKALSHWWEGKRKYMELFVYSPDVRSFSVALGETDGSLQCDDYQNALSKVRSLEIMSSNIHAILDFNLTDII